MTWMLGWPSLSPLIWFAPHLQNHSAAARPFCPRTPSGGGTPNETPLLAGRKIRIFKSNFSWRHWGYSPLSQSQIKRNPTCPATPKGRTPNETTIFPEQKPACTPNETTSQFHHLFSIFSNANRASPTKLQARSRLLFQPYLHCYSKPGYMPSEGGSTELTNLLHTHRLRGSLTRRLAQITNGAAS